MGVYNMAFGSHYSALAHYVRREFAGVAIRIITIWPCFWIWIYRPLGLRRITNIKRPHIAYGLNFQLRPTLNSMVGARRFCDHSRNAKIYFTTP